MGAPVIAIKGLSHCRGLQLYIERGWIHRKDIYDSHTLQVTRIIYFFLAHPRHDMSKGLCPNFCPACGSPFEAGSPTCTDAA
jgi:hypothetical protein